MINKTLVLTYIYLLIYIILSSGVNTLQQVGFIPKVLQFSTSYNADDDPYGVLWIRGLPSYSRVQGI
ncbi:hypothetical protein DY000_02050276 [Brassica cretica]|uniref:Uncharacterized protein n=1 Tax=Brassica cretica TaxID=69181 RepID=A0ABQ7F7Y3_BRACR|nr:hypothetical protein DY000_02050276 [Brassica cretica]